MSVEMAIWRMSAEGPLPLTESKLDLERRLEDMLVKDVSIIGTKLLVVGRQVQTAYGGYVDVLALDANGRVHVIEIKRDRTPRDVVAQTLDYGSWAQALSLDDLEQLFLKHNDADAGLDEAFAQMFEEPLPDVVNAEQQFTIVASELDPTSDRIVEFLAENYGVPINAVFFRHFADEGRDYLARTWLLDPRDAEVKAARAPRSKVRPWNGRDFYVIQGRLEPSDERWQVARKFGLLNAGGGSWYWKPLNNLTPGSRVFAYVGGAGYVGVGRVVGELLPAREAEVDVDGQRARLIDQPELGVQFRERVMSEDPEVTEMVVPVEWLKVRAINDAIRETGLFASQVTACKLRDERTIEVLEGAFGLAGDA